MEKFIKKLKKLNAYSEAIEWVKTQKTPQEAWDLCERGDWMLWFAGKLSGKPESNSRKILVLAACKCTRLVLKYIKKGEKRPLKAIQTAEAWAKNKKDVSLCDVKKAAYTAVADAAVADADADADADAAYTATDAAAYAAAYAAYTAAAYAAYTAVADADAAAYAAYAAAAAAADAVYAVRQKTLKKCADIVREFYPTIPSK